MLERLDAAGDLPGLADAIDAPCPALAVERLAERDRVVGIACINAIGCLGGFAGPNLIGRFDVAGLAGLALGFAVFAGWVLALRRPSDAAPERARAISPGLAMG